MNRNFLKTGIVISLLWPLLLWAQDDGGAIREVEVVAVTDLHKLGQEAHALNIPIMMMLSADGCSWCVKLEEEHLKPMLRSGDYKERVLIRQLKIDDAHDVRDFDGRPVSADRIGARYGVLVTPTVIYLDGDGRQLAKKIVGISSDHYYGSYVDMAIDQALKTLQPNRLPKARMAQISSP